MPIITPPKIVQDALDEFLAPLFKNKPQRNHLANYLTGLMISDNKTVAGITAEMPNASDQSCLNRFMTEVEWDEHAVNEARIDWLQQSDDTKFHPRGVIAIDDVLLDKSGKFIKDSGTFWDHCEQRYKHAQDLIIVNYVHPTSGKHYPLEFRRFKKESQCEWTGEEFKKMTELTVELIDWCHEKKVLGNFTFDSFYTCAPIQNHINALKNEDGTPRGYIGDLKFNRKLTFKGVEQEAAEFAKTIPPSDRKPVTVDGMKQWYLTVCVTMPNIDHKVRVVILWRYKNDAEPRKILVTNKIHWNAERIIETYRGRWTGTETFHRDGKQELGLGDCQLRDGAGQIGYWVGQSIAFQFRMRQRGIRWSKAAPICRLPRIAERRVRRHCHTSRSQAFITPLIDEISFRHRIDKLLSSGYLIGCYGFSNFRRDFFQDSPAIYFLLKMFDRTNICSFRWSLRRTK